MESFDFDSSVLAVIVVLASLAKLVKVLFATLRTCVHEYYSFRKWLSHVQRENGKRGDES